MFKEIAKITLRHHYYRNGYCKDIRLYQDNQTVQLMRRRGCLLRQRSPSEYVILAEEGTSFNPDDQFWFFLEVCDPAFLYNTLKEDWNADLFEHKQLKMKLKPKENGMLESVDLIFSVAEYYWKFIMIPRNPDQQFGLLLLEDALGSVRFEKVDADQFMGRLAYCCISTDKVPMQENYEIRLCLKESLTYGTRVLQKYIQAPVPGRFPVDRPDTIEQIIYI